MYNKIRLVSMTFNGRLQGARQAALVFGRCGRVAAERASERVRAITTYSDRDSTARPSSERSWLVAPAPTHCRRRCPAVSLYRRD